MSQFKNVKIELLNTQKTWLVTGAAGFIGSNLTEFLLKHGQKVVALDNLSTGYQKNLDDLLNNAGKNVLRNFTFIEGDISNVNTCKSACRGVDIILHQAALGSVPRSISNPIATNLSNVTGFLNLLQTAKDVGIKRFVYASSSSVYGDSKELPKVEARIGKPLSPYAVTKYSNEIYANVFSNIFKMETIGLRYFNVFGKRQDPNGAYAAVIPKWIDALINAHTTTIYGDGETSRDFTYIDNVIQANILAGLTENCDAFGEAFNVAAGGRDSLNDLHDIINNSLQKLHHNFQPQQPLYKDFRVGDITHSNANISKIESILGYEPSHTLKEGMELTIQWYNRSK